MTTQKRLIRVMRKQGWRVADLARALDRPYTTVREWVLFGRDPADAGIEKLLRGMEKQS